MAAAAAAAKSLRTEKLDEAQASARSCAGRPDFLPCDGVSVRHGKCFKLHWCCHLGWCHCKYVYQPMTSVGQLPSTTVPPAPAEHGASVELSTALAERFLKLAPCFRSPPHLQSPKYCVIADLFVDDYIVKRINGKMCYVQRPPPPQLPEPPHTPPPSARPPRPPCPLTPPAPSSARRPSPGPPSGEVGPPSPPRGRGPPGALKGPQIDHCSSPSSSEDSGINALDVYCIESCEEEEEEEEEGEGEEEEEEEADEDELSTDGNSSLRDQDSVLSPSKSMMEIIEEMETTV